ncbi:MAG: hypothetical protein GWN79_21525, partial [Actinobacteria bacterium]|nr:hypothetical protein [Actinomycetota bacterium]
MPEPAIALTRLRDREFREQAFRLERDGSLVIQAVGECVRRDDGCADHAWILEVGTGKTAWEMSWRNT